MPGLAWRQRCDKRADRQVRPFVR